MKGDFTRSTFRRERHFSGVRMQQGRVQLDADWNEQLDLTAHLERTEALDVIGASGAPLHAPALRALDSAASLDAATQARLTTAGLLPLAANDLLFTPGRFYAEGVLCEVEDFFTLAHQPDFPGATVLPGPGTYLVYLDVWERHVTALEDRLLKEVALGGPDTGTRTQTVWQVKFLASGDNRCVYDLDLWRTLLPVSTGRLAARSQPVPISTDACILPPGAGYRRLENQLYRVEIHTPGDDGTATFKWSRDNGSVVTGITQVIGPTIWAVEDLGPDDALGFQPGQIVEYADHATELNGTPGELLEISFVDPATNTITFAAAPATAPDFTRRPKLRRWEGATPGDAVVQAGVVFPLEDGVEVVFAAGRYNTGDFWLIPARTATGDVEWPRDTALNPQPLPPHGIRHRYASLAIVAVGAGGITTVRDCRRVFPPLTEIADSSDWLRRHNRFLHGWGVVCGLQVRCASGARENVTVERGYALECDGAELRVSERSTVPVVELAAGAELLDQAGNGRVCVTVRNAPGSRPEFGVQRPPATQSFLREILEGTLLNDVFEQCVQPLLRELRELFTRAADNDTALVPQPQRRLTAAMNLLVQLGGDPATHRIYLSPAEHALLREVHARLVELLVSPVFCALRDDLRPFPDYPFTDRRPADTFFGRQLLTRVRVARDGRTAWAFSPEVAGTIAVFDTESGEMTREIALPAMAGMTLGVQDVAFLMDGTAVVAAGDAAGSAVFVFRPGAAEPNRQAVLAGRRIARLHFIPALAAEGVLALVIGQGAGWLDPAAPARGVQIVAEFNASGHWAPGEGVLENRVWATAGQGVSAPAYNQIAEITLDGRSAGMTLDNLAATGRDDLAVLSGGRLPTLHVVLDPLVNTTAKRLRTLQAGRTAAEFALPTDGPVTLLGVAGQGTVFAALPEEHAVLRLPAGATVADRALDLPVQIAPSGFAPVATAGTTTRGSLLVANRTSRTLTRIEPEMLAAGARFDFTALEAYRRDALAAFLDVGLRLLQRLKDCVCERLLVNCPSCGPDDDVIVLACVEIRGRQVHHICNHDRREVVTFPKLFYWLSAIPVIPALTWLVEKFCCMPVAGVAGRLIGGRGNLLSKQQLARVDVAATGRQFRALGGTLQQRTSGTAKIAMAAGLAGIMRAPADRRDMAVNDLPAATAADNLRAAGVEVAAVEDFDQSVADRGLSAVSGLRFTARPGERVRLLVKDGRVAAMVADVQPGIVAAPPGGTPPPAVLDENSRRELTAMREELTALRAAHVAAVAERDRVVSGLRQEMLALRPTTPIAPVAPVTPFVPVTPVTPVSPVVTAPVSPVSPVMPLNPGVIAPVKRARRKRAKG
ncbi:MAG: DUF6519 domain-containing protein [Limisphaerales bacterium]